MAVTQSPHGRETYRVDLLQTDKTVAASSARRLGDDIVESPPQISCKPMRQFGESRGRRQAPNGWEIERGARVSEVKVSRKLMSDLPVGRYLLSRLYEQFRLE